MNLGYGFVAHNLDDVLLSICWATLIYKGILVMLLHFNSKRLL